MMERQATMIYKINNYFRALEVWGSREAMLRELVKKELELKTYQQSMQVVLRKFL